MEPKFFTKSSAFRKWLEKNHEKKTELLVGFYKVGSGKPSITWPQSVDEALCFGWIDGVRRTVDEESYSIRFTPRRPGSNWSAINIKKIKELTGKGLMQPAGIAAFEKREDKKSEIYSYENEPVSLSKEYEKLLKANKKAWTFFNSRPAYYRKVATNWVMSAKQEKTRDSRLEALIKDSEAGEKIKPLRYGKN